MGNALRAQPIHERLVVAPQFDVFQAPTSGQHVVSEIQDVIALVVA